MAHAKLASVLGAAFYVLLGDWLSTLWPRWLLLLGVVLMIVSLGLQRGLWGLGESLWALVRRKGPADAESSFGQTSPSSQLVVVHRPADPAIGGRRMGDEAGSLEVDYSCCLLRL